MVRRKRPFLKRRPGSSKNPSHRRGWSMARHHATSSITSRAAAGSRLETAARGTTRTARCSRVKESGTVRQSWWIVLRLCCTTPALLSILAYLL
eukprot:978062-Prymnesium_polylepis.1